MQSESPKHPQTHQITPAKILEDLLEVSEQEFTDSQFLKGQSSQHILCMDQQHKIIEALDQKKAYISKKKQNLQQIQTSILKTNKFQEQFIELHDERRVIEKDIIDLEFEVIRLERDLDIKRRNKSAVTIIEDEESDQQQGHSGRRPGNSTIRQAPEELEESLQLSEIRRMAISSSSIPQKGLLDSFMLSSVKKQGGPQPQANIRQLKQKEDNSRSRKVSEGKDKSDSMEKWRQKSCVLLGDGVVTRRRKWGQQSPSEFYRQEMERSMIESCLTMDYLNFRYLS